MAKWEVKNEIDYSPNGDDIDTFSQKVKAEENVIYNLLQRLRTLDASTSDDVDDAEAYQLKINATTDKILIRNKTNTAWIKLGDLADNFGITPALISAIKNLGGATGVQVGNIANRPVANNSIDGTFFYAIDDGSLSYFHNGTWILALSLDIAKLTGYANMITKDDVSVTNAANKILRTDTDGKLDTSIKGSAEKIVDLPLDKTNIGDGKVVAYDAAGKKLYFEVSGASAGGGSAIGVIAGRESLKVYAVGDRAYSSRLSSGSYLVCVKAGTSAEYQPDYTIISNGKVVDGTVEWRIDKLSNNNIQFTSDTPTNQLDGDMLIQKQSDAVDGGKNSGLFIKNSSGVYVPVYLKTNAGQVKNTPAGNISATTVQEAINELDTEKAPAGYGLGESCKAVAGDWDDYTTTGFFRGNNLAHAPETGTDYWFFVDVCRHTDDYVYQQAHGFGSSTKVSWERTKNNETWSAWKRLATTESPTLTGTVTLDGGQLKFPATQNASSDPNTLDDYEEGTWTPTLYGSETAGSYDISSINAQYTKIGNIVHVLGFFYVAVASAGTGGATIGGLPFAKAVNSEAVGSISIIGCSLTEGFSIMFTNPFSAVNTLGVYKDAGVPPVPITSISTGNIYLSITYRV